MEKITDKELLDELKSRFDKNKKDLDELQRLNKELVKVNKKLEESESLKSHFISNIANEIVNPFTSILALSKTVLSVNKEDWKTVISMVALIHSEAFNLDFQLKNIFMAAQIEAGSITPDVMDVDINSLIKKIIEPFKIEANKKKIKTHFITKIDSKDKENYFKTDPEKFKLIITNVVNNAIQFSDKEKEIEIKVDKLGSKMKISVIDHGIGMNEEEQKVIFDRFKRTNNEINELNKGYGLGLSVTKALIEFLEGQIEIFSQKNVGTNVTIILPEMESDSAGFAFDGDEFLFDDNETF
jgi:signal transduction histidine kinase